MYRSNVTINNKMYIKKADDSFLRYTGVDMSASVMKALHPDDRDRFRNAIEDLNLDGIPQNVVYLRLKNAQDMYTWVTVDLKYETYGIQEQKLIHLIFSDWKRISEYRESYDAEQLQKQRKLHEEYQSRLINEIRENGSFDATLDKDESLDILNKRAITEYAHKVIEKKWDKRNYFIVFDIDHFKTINDTFGHMYGDEVLVTIAGIVKSIVSNRGLVGRIGGDEIMIVTNAIETRAELKNMLRSIRTTVEWTYKGKCKGISLTCSMGAAAFPEDGSTYEEIFELADKMLYLSKNKGRNRYIIYTPELHEGYIKNVQPDNVVAALPQDGEDRIFIMQQMLEEYLIQHTMKNETLFSQIGTNFEMDEIMLLYEKESVGFSWTKEGISSDIRTMEWLKTDDEFYECFNEEGLFLVHGMYVLEENLPEKKEVFEAHQIRAAMFYQLKRNGERDGLVMFARREQRGKWSEYEIMTFATIAKVFELAVR